MTRKTQKKLRKLLTLVSCAVLLVCVTVVGTVAYLTSTTQTVENTFTVGNVAITLDEEDVDEYGVSYTNAKERVMANQYKMIPGHEYKKDPTVHISEGSEDCWVFVKVDINVTETTETAKTIASQLTNKGWTCVDATNNIWGYNTMLSNSGTKDAVAFNTFTLANTYASGTDVSEMSINITAYAVQADGFNSAAVAYAAAPCTAWTAATPAT